MYFIFDVGAVLREAGEMGGKCIQAPLTFIYMELAKDGVDVVVSTSGEGFLGQIRL